MILATELQARETNLLLRIGRDDVSADEFHFFAVQERAQALQFLRTPLASPKSLESHPDIIEAAQIRAHLVRKTLHRVQREKTEQALFRELGLVADIRFETFLANLDRLNHERAKLKQRGQVIYGPVQYTPLNYYNHWMANLRIAAKAKLAATRFDLSEAALQEFYRKHRDRYVSPESSSWEIFTLSADNAGNGVLQTNLAAVARACLREIKAGRTPKPDPSAGIQLTTAPFVDVADRLSELLSTEALAERAHTLPAGKCALVPLADGRYQIVKCVARRPSEPRKLSEIRSAVRNHCAEAQYARLLDKRVAQAEVSINQPALDALSLP